MARFENHAVFPHASGGLIFCLEVGVSALRSVWRPPAVVMLFRLSAVIGNEVHWSMREARASFLPVMWKLSNCSDISKFGFSPQWEILHPYSIHVHAACEDSRRWCKKWLLHWSSSISTQLVDSGKLQMTSNVNFEVFNCVRCFSFSRCLIVL